MQNWTWLQKDSWKNLTLATAILSSLSCASAFADMGGNPPAPPPKWGENQIPKNGIGLYVNVDALLWQAHQTNTEFVLKNPAGEDPATYVGPEKSPDFKYDWGVRVGAGYTMKNHDDWDIYLDWTHFKTYAHRSVSAGSSYALEPILSSVYGGNLTADKATSHWKLDLNMIDLELGKRFNISRFFSLRGFAGLRNAWVYQHENVTYSGGLLEDNGRSPDKVHLKNDFWGLGLLVGLETQWGMGAGFSIYADAAASILSGYYKLQNKETANGTVQNNVRDSFHTGKWVTDLALGVRWDKTFSNDHYHIGIKTGWEQHLFINQFQWGAQDASPFTTTDLSIQGWILSARFDF